MFPTLREIAQIAVLALILCFCFFVLVGAFSPGEVPEMTMGVVVLAVAWLVYAVVMTRRQKLAGGRDEMGKRQRERRGF